LPAPERNENKVKRSKNDRPKAECTGEDKTDACRWASYRKESVDLINDCQWNPIKDRSEQPQWSDVDVEKCASANRQHTEPDSSKHSKNERPD
jgi:hypothetical protein